MGKVSGVFARWRFLAVFVLLVVSVAVVSFSAPAAAQTSPKQYFTGPYWLDYDCPDQLLGCQAYEDVKYQNLGSLTNTILDLIANTPYYNNCQPVLVINNPANVGYPVYTPNVAAYIQWQNGCQLDGETTYGPLIRFKGTLLYYDAAKATGSGRNCDAGEGGSDNGTGASGASGDAEKDSSAGCDSQATAGDPINVSNGNKFTQETDFRGNKWLQWRRFYSSQAGTVTSELGPQWRHIYDRSLTVTGQARGGSAAIATLMRPDGKSEGFENYGFGWQTSDRYNVDSMVALTDGVGNVTGYTVFIAAMRQVETYDLKGHLLSVADQDGQQATLAYSTTATPASVAPVPGLLTSINDPNGRQLNFFYDASSRMNRVLFPDGQSVTYSYDSNGMLAQATLPGGKSRQYRYGEAANDPQSNPVRMTGLYDELGVRLQDTTYDDSGRATGEWFAGNVDVTTATYDQANGNYDTTGGVTVGGPLGSSTKFTWDNTTGARQVGSVSSPCGPACRQPSQAISYDSNGRASSFTDFNGVIATLAHDSSGLPSQRVEASGTSLQRTINVTWDDTLRLPLTREVLDVNNVVVAHASWAYDATGNLLAECGADPTVANATSYACSATGSVPAGIQRRSYTYCATVNATNCPVIGLGLTATGERTDVNAVTTYAYYMVDGAAYRHGDLKSVTDPLGHVTTFSTYDAAGRPTREVDPNGTVIDLGYTVRGWLASRTVRANADGSASTADATTTYTYTDFGALQTMVDPDGVTATYTYDAAHRLTRVTDGAGNYVTYTLDALGHRTSEVVTSASGTTTAQLSRQFNILGQLAQVINAQSVPTTLAYDPQGQLTDVTDGRGSISHWTYDALRRTTQQTDDYNGVAALTKNTATGYGYDANDRLLAETDPSQLSTTYVRDGLGRTTATSSPDAGSSSKVRDLAGNVTQWTDARSVKTTAAYDALNRLTKVTYPTTTLDVTRAYDQTNATTGCASSFPVGRLTTTTDASGTTTFCYDRRGNVTVRKQVVGGVTSTVTQVFSKGDRLSQLTYPSGTVASYARNALGQVTSVNVTPAGGAATSLVSSVSYRPFGAATAITYGNGAVQTRTYDGNGWMTDISGPGVSLHYTYDAVGNLTAEGSAAGANPASELYTYDALSRLTQVQDGTGTPISAYGLNPAGDRTSKTLGTGAPVTYAYLTGSHKLTGAGTTTYAYDADGNRTGLLVAGVNKATYTYDDRGLITTYQPVGGTASTYQYDADGLRVSKTTGSTAATYLYNGSTLLAETGLQGQRDYVYLDGKLVGVVTKVSGGTGTVAYVETDGLGTPRAVLDNKAAVIWSWAWTGNTFGEVAPNTAPSGGSPFILNLRYPGQYADAESGLNYNIHRYYDPSVGRYIQADPMGLRAGPNLYAYVRNNPYVLYDPYGLDTFQLGWSFSGSIGDWSFAGGLGLALDTCGNLAIYADGGTGVGVGDDLAEGLSAQYTTAPTVNDLAGTSLNVSASGGDGLGASLDATQGFYGSNSDQPYLGAGATFGANVGASVSDIVTRTKIYPVTQLW
jgi:RHS repeat-associated protein